MSSLARRLLPKELSDLITPSLALGGSSKGKGKGGARKLGGASRDADSSMDSSVGETSASTAASTPARPVKRKGAPSAAAGAGKQRRV